MDSTLYIGARVHFVMADGTHRPAIVVNITDSTNVDLQVFDAAENGVFFQACCYHYETPIPYTWHFIEQA